MKTLIVTLLLVLGSIQSVSATGDTKFFYQYSDYGTSGTNYMSSLDSGFGAGTTFEYPTGTTYYNFSTIGTRSNGDYYSSVNIDEPQRNTYIIKNSLTGNKYGVKAVERYQATTPDDVQRSGSTRNRFYRVQKSILGTTSVGSNVFMVVQEAGGYSELRTYYTPSWSGGYRNTSRRNVDDSTLKKTKVLKITDSGTGFSTPVEFEVSLTLGTREEVQSMFYSEYESSTYNIYFYIRERIAGTTTRRYKLKKLSLSTTPTLEQVYVYDTTTSGYTQYPMGVTSDSTNLYLIRGLTNYITILKKSDLTTSSLAVLSSGYIVGANGVDIEDGKLYMIERYAASNTDKMYNLLEVDVGTGVKTVIRSFYKGYYFGISSFNYIRTIDVVTTSPVPVTTSIMGNEIYNKVITIQTITNTPVSSDTILSGKKVTGVEESSNQVSTVKNTNTDSWVIKVKKYLYFVK